MRYPLLSILLITVALTYSACSKNSATPDLVPTQQNFSTQLSRIYQLDSTLPVGKDTVFSQYYTYDNSNRLILETEYIANPHGDSFNLSTIKFEYAGTDTLASRTTRKTITIGYPLNTTIDTANYNFLNGRYASDSIRYSGQAYSLANFSYAPGKVIRYFHNFVFAYSYSDTERSVFYQTISNNNITYQIDTLVSNDNNSSPLTNYQLSEFLQTYLPNPNPLYKIISPVHTEYLSNWGIGNFSTNKFAPKNLITQQTLNSKNWTSSSGSGNPITTNTLNYDYTFRSDGYPLMARITENVNNTLRKTKLVFSYK